MSSHDRCEALWKWDGQGKSLRWWNVRKTSEKGKNVSKCENWKGSESEENGFGETAERDHYNNTAVIGRICYRKSRAKRTGSEIGWWCWKYRGAMTVHQCDNEGIGPSSKPYGTSSPSALTQHRLKVFYCNEKRVWMWVCVWERFHSALLSHQHVKFAAELQQAKNGNKKAEDKEESNTDGNEGWRRKRRNASRRMRSAERRPEINIRAVCE